MTNKSNKCNYKKCGKLIVGMAVTVNKCAHTYCYSCFLEWFDKSPHCPMDGIETSVIHFCDEKKHVLASLSSDDVYYEMILGNLQNHFIKMEKVLIETYIEKEKSLEMKLKPIQSYFHHRKLLEHENGNKKPVEEFHEFLVAKSLITEVSGQILDITQEFQKLESDIETVAFVIPSYKEMEHCPLRKTVKYLYQSSKVLRETVHYFTKLTIKMSKRQEALEMKYNECVKGHLNDDQFRKRINSFFRENCQMTLCVKFDRMLSHLKI